MVSAARSTDPEVRSFAYGMLFDPTDPRIAVRGVSMLTGYENIAMLMIALVAAMILIALAAVLGYLRNNAKARRVDPGARLFFPYAPMLITGLIASLPVMHFFWFSLSRGVPDNLFVVRSTVGTLCLAVFFIVVLAICIRDAGSSFDSQGFTCVSEGRPFRFAWNDIVFARRGLLPGITLGTRDGAVFHLAFNAAATRAVWKGFSSRLPREVFEAGAFHRMQELAGRGRHAGEFFPIPVVIAAFNRSMVLGYALTAGLFGTGLAIALAIPEATVLATCFCLAGAFVLVDLPMRTLTLAGERIRVDPAWGRSSVSRSWKEITSVKLSAEGATLAFEGGGKPLRVRGPAHWHRYDRDTAFLTLLQYLDYRGIPVQIGKTRL